jgi:hypothetical protein
MMIMPILDNLMWLPFSLEDSFTGWWEMNFLLSKTAYSFSAEYSHFLMIWKNLFQLGHCYKYAQNEFMEAKREEYVIDYIY